MANRYVRSTGGNWSAAGTWESASGAKDVVTVPGNTDDVFIDAQSGASTIDADINIKSFDGSAITTSMTQAAGVTLTISGNATFKYTNANYYISDDTSILKFDTNATIEVGGGPPTTYFGLPNLLVSAGTLTLHNPTTVHGNVTVSAGAALSLASGFLVLGKTPVTMTGDITIDDISLMFLTPHTTGGVSTGGVFIIDGTLVLTGGLEITGETTVTIKAGATFTLTQVYSPISSCVFNSSTPGTPATISIASGDITFNECSITDITAEGGATYTAINCIDGGGNTGITFLHMPRRTPRINQRDTGGDTRRRG